MRTFSLGYSVGVGKFSLRLFLSLKSFPSYLFFLASCALTLDLGDLARVFFYYPWVR